MRHFFILNPRSFRTLDEQKNIEYEISRYFMKSGGNYKIHISRYPRDAIAVIQRYVVQVPSSETIRIYAVGGDGILFDCLNGMVGIKNVELTSVPYGKVNSFVRVFGPGARKRFRDLPALINGRPHPVDIINCGTNYALNFAVLGLEAQAVIKGDQFMRYLSKKWAMRLSAKLYVLFALISIFNKDVMRQWYRVNIDGDDISDRYFNINISNNACSGEKNIPSPNVLPNDGMLNISFAKRSERILKLLKSVPAYTRGKKLNEEYFFEKRAHVVKITSDTPISVHIDGEAFQTYALKFEIVEHGIQFVAPEGMEIYDYSRKGRRG
jgi:diacylglycerol kinase family enzyme